MNARNLESRVAIITGGGGAIGSATARRLARAGALVAVADINPDAAVKVVDEIKAEGLGAAAFTVDLAEEDQIRALVSDVVRTFGRLDILHNNAAAGPNVLRAFGGDLKLLELSGHAWDQAFAVNARAPMLLSQLAIPHFLDQGGGVIVNTSTGGSESPVADGLTAYGSSKGAMNTLTRYIAAQYGSQNIRCNAVLPGAVLTKGMQNIFSQAQLDEMVSRTMLRRITLPEDVAALVHFLVSDDARQITGQFFRIDAGRL
jgi:NAD(P)-dependent dehydrogenase (short-subunit alcohol dehydrogenase family)